MKFSHVKFAFSLFGIMFLLGGCAGNESKNKNSANSSPVQTSNTNEIVVRDDIEELGKIINLHIAPTESTFSENNLTAAPNGKKIVAVLKFAAADAERIVAQAGKHQTPIPSDVEAESWFPPELVAQSQVSGDEVLKGVGYAANDFFQSPYTKGRLTRINNTDYFVLELTSF
jgi:hypothetical protein